MQSGAFLSWMCAFVGRAAGSCRGGARGADEIAPSSPRGTEDLREEEGAGTGAAGAAQPWLGS